MRIFSSSYSQLATNMMAYISFYDRIPLFWLQSLISALVLFNILGYRLISAFVLTMQLSQVPYNTLDSIFTLFNSLRLFLLGIAYTVAIT